MFVVVVLFLVLCKNRKNMMVVKLLGRIICNSIFFSHSDRFIIG